MEMAWDIHKDYVATLSLIDGESVIDKRPRDVVEIPATYDEIENYVKTLPKDVKIVFEAGMAWEFIYDILVQHGIKPIVVNPADVQPPKKQTRKKRNDFEALKRMLTMLHMGVLESIVVLPKDERDRRDMLRTRSYLVKQLVQTKNRILSLLAKQGIKPEFTDKFGVAGRKMIDGLTGARPFLISMHVELDILDKLNEKIAEIDGEIAKTALEIKAIQQLMTIPGLGCNLASTIIFELGNTARFQNGRQLACYIGLTPCLDQSGNIERLGHISKEGNATLRWAFVEAANAHVRTKGINTDLKRLYDRVKGPKGHGKAVVAVARKMAVVVHAMLRDGTFYVPMFETEDEKDLGTEPTVTVCLPIVGSVQLKESVARKCKNKYQVLKHDAKEYDLGDPSKVCEKAVRLASEED